MPFRSQAQRRLFHSDPKLKKYAPQWEADTPHDRPLPERLRVPRMTGRHRLPRRKKTGE
jgi:hypothetical protein